MGRKFESCRAGQLEILHILLQNITAFDIKYFYEGFDYRTGSIFYTSNSDRPAIGLVSQHINLDVKLWETQKD